jgi:phosphatidylethanolamine-binding protein (PEBP) family uncharacterized protein
MQANLYGAMPIALLPPLIDVRICAFFAANPSHRYYFRMYAVDKTLNLEAVATKFRVA